MKTKTNRELRQEAWARLAFVLIGLAACVGFTHDALSAEPVKVKAPSAKVLKTIYQAAKRFDVDAQALIKIAYVESSFKADARRANANGTVDFGMFQVNSVHWSTTCKAFDVFTLRGNALCAAKILSKHEEHAENDPDWVGRYHSKTPTLKKAYADKLASITLEGDSK